MTSLFS